MARIPIACTLSADASTERVGKWRGFLSDDVAQTVRTEHTVRLQLQEGNDAVLAATDLARREKAGCAFFEFRLVLLPEAVWLEVDAPDEAASVLDELINLRSG
ncbi:MAG: hypothetical protein ACYDB7_10295 [Mycobacteriales bacterium]